MHKNYKIVAIITILYLNGALGNDKCALKDNCEECLTEDYSCAWCTDKHFNGTSRCMLKANLLRENCLERQIIENKEEFNIIDDEPTRDYITDNANKNAKSVQLRPQKLKMKLVKGKTQEFKMTYRLAENHPLDLYFLMDLTWSMKDDKETLIKLGNELSQTLAALTKNYRLGFGSFADKPGMPINPSEKFHQNPCSYEGATCEPTYDFQHHLPLTSNIELFIKKVTESEITGNLDNLEGQFDALMQVLVCTDTIDWSNDARKVVVLATDGYVHLAGDGLLLGVTQKNDKKCHLNKDGLYDSDLIYDYPSVEEIYRELLKRKVNVIFAVEQTVYPHYSRIGDLLKEVSAVEILSSNSSNILELVRTAYQSFINKVQFQDTSPDIISVQYFTDCGGSYNSIEERNSCKNIKLGEEIDFFIKITLNEFPKDNNWTHIIRIEEPGLSEAVEIEIEIQKPCPCQEEPIKDYTGRAPCNNHGHLSCGMCVCDENWLGTLCACDSGNYTTNKALENECRLPYTNNKFGSLCSNHGECDCGKCQCNFGYVGKYCECQICPNCNYEYEECLCGRCICKYGFMDERCCVKPKNGCINPIDKSVCSNNGDCDVCIDKCSCKENYLGKYCEYNKNSTENQGFCEKYEPCVKFLIYNKQNQIHSEDFDKVCKDKNGNLYEYEIKTEKFDTNLKCLIRLKSDDDDEKLCDHYFIYEIDEKEISYLTIMQNDCEPPKYALVGYSVAIGTFILGFLGLIIYKIIIVVNDRKEFDKFNKEVLEMHQNLQSGAEESNPLYKNPITYYSMPKLDEE